MKNLRFFESLEDFNRDPVKIEFLIREDGYYFRKHARFLVQGKVFKTRKGWQKLEISDSDFKQMCKAFRNGKPYKIKFTDRFLYSGPVKQSVGPTR